MSVSFQMFTLYSIEKQTVASRFCSVDWNAFTKPHRCTLRHPTCTVPWVYIYVHFTFPNFRESNFFEKTIFFSVKHAAELRQGKLYFCLIYIFLLVFLC